MHTSPRTFNSVASPGTSTKSAPETIKNHLGPRSTWRHELYQTSSDNPLSDSLPATATMSPQHSRRKTRAMFQSAKFKEKAGRWKEASDLLTTILKLDPTDAHTHLALAQLEAKKHRDKDPARARSAFQRGTYYCPNSVHLWHAWARFEEQQNRLDQARSLFHQALKVEKGNPYVCHSYGLMEQKSGLIDVAQQMWYQGLETKPTAALVCSLAELMISQRRLTEARDLYNFYGSQVDTKRDRTEIYLASAWLEEKYFRNFDKAAEWIHLALAQDSSNSGRAQVALARLEGRRNRRENKSGKVATRKRLSAAVQSVEQGTSESTDGRLFNALAHVEVKSRKFDEARKILQSGIQRFPDDVSVRA